jgi:prevent-host-death family protein
MKTLQVADLKANFSEILEDVKKGEEITISYGRKKEKIAVIVPYSKYKKSMNRKLGILEGKASYEISENFKLTDEEFLQS